MACEARKGKRVKRLAQASVEKGGFYSGRWLTDANGVLI